MSRRFQFSLGRLLALVSWECLAALLWRAGYADHGAKCGTPRVIADMVALVIAGTGLGLLAKNQVIGVCLGGLASMGLIVAMHVVLLLIGA